MDDLSNPSILSTLRSLCFSSRLWGIKASPWLERPLYVVLREAILSCVTPDRTRLELLDAYLPWIKHDFVKDFRCKEIGEELGRQVKAIGGDEDLPHVGRRGKSGGIHIEHHVIVLRSDEYHLIFIRHMNVCLSLNVIWYHVTS